jgi:hypothetical protein
MFHAAWIAADEAPEPVAATVVNVYFEPGYESRVPPAPERPQRTEPSSTVRSGAGTALISDIS